MLLAQTSIFLKLIQPQNLLAILGGAAVGYFLVAAITILSVRATGGKVIPVIVLQAVRLLGALVAGWLVALWVLGIGGSGLGGSGGGGFGEGAGDPFNPGRKDERPVEKDLEVVRPKDQGANAERDLFIEVLLNEEIEKAIGPVAVAEKRYYRVRGSGADALLTLKAVRELIATSKPPFKKLYIVLGKDRSDREVARVRDLAATARTAGLSFDYTAP